jgi:hypothetical protein
MILGFSNIRQKQKLASIRRHARSLDNRIILFSWGIACTFHHSIVLLSIASFLNTYTHWQGTGTDSLLGGTGNDVYSFAKKDGQDLIVENDAILGNTDKLLFDNTVANLHWQYSKQTPEICKSVIQTAVVT